MDKNIIIIILILINTTFSSAFAHETNENSINKLYNRLIVLMHPQTNNALEKFKEMPEAIDIAIEIIKKSPSSLEAFGALHFFRRGMEYHDNTIKKYCEIKNKFMPLLDNIEDDLAEKLILLRLMFLRDPGTLEKEANQNYYTCLKTLIKIKDECKNTDFAALALSCLFAENIVGQEPIDEFIQKYPQHPAIPNVMLEKTIKLINHKKVDEAINEINKINKQYGNLPRPEGYNFEIECYWTLIVAYLKKGENSTAKKYYEIIKEKAPNNLVLFDLKQVFENSN